MANGKIHIGTSGWSYKEWKGAFYPKELKPGDWLSWYARTFGVTEINSSFYHLPSVKTVNAWLDKTPTDFLFCPKMSRYLTHYQQLLSPEEPLERFFHVFEALRSKMGPVLIQLPSNVTFDRKATISFLQLLHDKYNTVRFALEIRNDSWLTEEVKALLSRYNVTFVISYSGNRFPHAAIVTTRNIYIRLHGPNGRYNTTYTEEALISLANNIVRWAGESREIWVFFNNTFHAGHAIQNALRLKTLLGINCQIDRHTSGSPGTDHQD